MAPNATVCGDVTVGESARILFGAAVVAEGGHIEIGRSVIILENAVVRSTAKHSTSLGEDTLIGPHAHVVGCTLEASVFVATGAAVFHAAHLGSGTEVRVNGVVHLRTRLPANTMVPIGWIAVGDPPEILPPHEHDKIWARQEPLNFPMTVYGVERATDGTSIMPQVAAKLSKRYGCHRDDMVLEGG